MSKKSKQIPIRELKSEDGAKEILSSPEMEPYLRLAMAQLQNADLTDNVREIADIPLEKRYVWRVASALKWGFADFDSFTVEVDRQTLSPADLQKMADLLRLRPAQFCIFLKTLFGMESMERMMKSAIAMAKES